jgi:hypothetical protein
MPHTLSETTGLCRLRKYWLFIQRARGEVSQLVTRLHPGWSDNRSSIPSGGRCYSINRRVQIVSGAHSAPCPVGIRFSFLEGFNWSFTSAYFRRSFGRNWFMFLNQAQGKLYIFVCHILRTADHSGGSVYGMNCLRSLERWDREFESHSGMDVCIV